MSAKNKLVALIACFTMFALPAAAASYEARTMTYHRHFTRTAGYCPMHRTAGGTLVDCHGWRLRSNAIGWDPTCHNLGYLPSEFACGSTGE
jgi:hypothetical protein